VNRLVAIGLLAFALAGCGSGKSSDEPAASTKPASPPPMATTPTTTTTVACSRLDGAGLGPVATGEVEGQQTMFLTGVSVGSAECSDTVTFTFEKHAPGPGYEISYEPADTAKTEDGSGRPVAVRGDAFLVVRLKPAMTAKIEGDQLTKTYTGPRRIPGGAGSVVQEVVKTGDFENVVTWVIGLDQKHRYTASADFTHLAVEIER